MDLTVILVFAVGLIALVGGAELFVRGAARLAVLVGISPLVVGLTVVAFGTSAPETAVAVQSAWTGQADIGIGNVVGSNICNILFILGLAALTAPLVVRQRVVRLDVPVMIGVSVLMLLLSLDGIVSTGNGVVLFMGAVCYVTFLIWQSRRERASLRTDLEEEYGVEIERGRRIWASNTVILVVGLAAIVLGSKALVWSATRIALAVGVSELLVGLTVVAFGTSLPEVATSVVASLRGERDIAVGNLVGSNVFNILVVLGLSATVAPGGIAVSRTALRFDVPVMIGVAVACLPIAFTGYRIERWEGGLFVLYYGIYLLYLGLDATGHIHLPLLVRAMAFFVLPITALTLIVMTIQHLRRSPEREPE